jgi:hypothetical protein
MVLHPLIVGLLQGEFKVELFRGKSLDIGDRRVVANAGLCDLLLERLDFE